MKKEGKNIKNLLTTYSTILEDIFTSFGVEYSHGKLTDYTNLKWFSDGISIWCIDDLIQNIPYCAEFGTCDDLIMYYHRNIGKKYYTIFDSNNKLSREEYDKLVNS
tara:strand:+ start:12479 stop:12796 length:318 start_codon:yes stop_codon:yes gene_type:complete